MTSCEFAGTILRGILLCGFASSRPPKANVRPADLEFYERFPGRKGGDVAILHSTLLPSFAATLCRELRAKQSPQRCAASTRASLPNGSLATQGTCVGPSICDGRIYTPARFKPGGRWAQRGALTQQEVSKWDSCFLSGHQPLSAREWTISISNMLQASCLCLVGSQYCQPSPVRRGTGCHTFNCLRV